MWITLFRLLYIKQITASELNALSIPSTVVRRSPSPYAPQRGRKGGFVKYQMLISFVKTGNYTLWITLFRLLYIKQITASGLNALSIPSTVVRRSQCCGCALGIAHPCTQDGQLHTMEIAFLVLRPQAQYLYCTIQSMRAEGTVLYAHFPTLSLRTGGGSDVKSQSPQYVVACSER